jgi:hypothetical protein
MQGARGTAGLGLGVLLTFGFIVSLCAVRCTYAPNFPSGELKCSTVQSCPEGYFCDKPSDLCYKNGETPSGAAGSGGAGGAGGAAGGRAGTGGAGGVAGAAGGGGAGGAKGPPCAGTCAIKIDGTLMNSMAPSTTSKFVGHWVFQTGSSEDVTCSDGSNKTTDLGASMDYVDITLISSTPTVSLDASYFCDWTLTLGPLGNAIIKPGQSCSRNSVDMTTGTTHFTWHGTTFTFKTDDSKTGTLSATIAVDYIDDPSKTGCSP